MITIIDYSPEYSPCSEDILNIQEPRDLQKCIAWHHFGHPRPYNDQLQEHEYARRVYKLRRKI